LGLKDLTTAAVTIALDEFDELGREAFLKRYGFKPARAFFVVRDEVQYDSKAIAGAAHGHIAPGWLPMRASEFSGGDETVAPALKALGFNVQNLTGKGQEPRNPSWSRDELILALDLYLTNPTSPPGKTSKAVIELSGVLNSIARQLGSGSATTFRNPNGVYMKMMNFRRFDPEVIASGKVGLTRGNKDEEVVWKEFAGDLDLLKKVSSAIRKVVADGTAPLFANDDDGDTMEAAEGRVLTRLHRTRERNRKLIDIKKAKVLNAAGRLACEVCDFDFALRYGRRGEGFIEAHHTKPVHALPEGGTTKLDDLVLVCSNCHRMIHAARPWLSIDELKSILAAT
jgi:5-methylcytosine-specific restriction protein A